MRNVRHWTPRYIYDRGCLRMWERANPSDPWLTRDAVRLLASLLRPCDRGVEFGSGRSTIWFAERVAALTSVEHDQEWYLSVSMRLKSKELTNVDYRLAPRDQSEAAGHKSEYARTALYFAEESVDFALIDGLYRDVVTKFVLPKIRPGGVVIIDNANWFLPSHSRSPSSRTATLGADGPVWREVAGDLGNWRSIWTSSGVTDTAIFIKPEAAS